MECQTVQTFQTFQTSNDNAEHETQNEIEFRKLHIISF